MQLEQLFDAIPFLGLYVGTVVLSLLSVEAGFRLGGHRRRRAEHEQETPVGAMVGATLGLLAFVLAFAFGMAATRFDTRKQLVLDEANAIGTAHLRAALLPQPERAELQRLLREYVDVRLQGVQPGKLQQAMARSEELHNLLWSQVVALGEKDPRSIVAGLFIQSLNEVIDLHAKRVTASLRNRIPGIIWVALYLVTVLAMVAVGYQTGLSSPRRSVVVLLLALAFAAIMLLTADLDRPQAGLLKVSQQALVDVRNSMRTPGR